jgi:hypothetical protein
MQPTEVGTDRFKIADEDITKTLSPMPGQVIRCFSRDAAPTGGIHGRVTDGLKTN